MSGDRESLEILFRRFYIAREKMKAATEESVAQHTQEAMSVLDEIDSRLQSIQEEASEERTGGM